MKSKVTVFFAVLIILGAGAIMLTILMFNTPHPSENQIAATCLIDFLAVVVSAFSLLAYVFGDLDEDIAKQIDNIFYSLLSRG